MVTHGLPSAHDHAAGDGNRQLDTGSASVADDGTFDTGFDNVVTAFADANSKGPYSVNVYKTGGASGGVLYFEIYNIGSGGAQGSAVSVDYAAVVERQ